MSDTPLDHDLVARIVENLKVEPSEQLRDMLARGAGDIWSPEALKAASLLLEQRTNGIAPEPVYRTTPAIVPADQLSRGWRSGDAVLAPGFSGLLSLGKDWLFAGRMGEIRDQSAYIYFYNGERGWVPLADVQPLTIDVGTRLYCRWRDQTGTIIRWQDEQERFYIRFDDGQGEWATLGKIEVPNQALSGDVRPQRFHADPHDEAAWQREGRESSGSEGNGSSVMDSLRDYRKPILMLFLWPVYIGGALLVAFLFVAIVSLLIQLVRSFL
jgi:hypothetical protein